MAITNRAEREKVTEIARLHLIALKTAGDFMSWYGGYHDVLGAKILGRLINDEYLRLESAKRELGRRLRQKAAERHMRDRDFPYSPENLARRGQGKGVGIAWSRERKAQIQDAKDIVEADRRADDITFSEGQGERTPRTGSDIEVQ